MESIHNLDGISDAGVLLPGVTRHTTGEDDPYMGEAFNLMQYIPRASRQPLQSWSATSSDFEGQAARASPRRT